MALRITKFARTFQVLGARAMSSGEWGSGAGKGGGSGGSVRDAGGAFGKREAAQEEQYFREKQAEQLRNLKEHLHDEVHEHERQIRRHQEAIERHKKRLEKLHKDDGSDSD